MTYPRLKILIIGLELQTFHLFGTIGFLTGTTLGIYLTLHQHLALWVLALMSLIGAIQLFAHTMIHKIITGEEELIYYRHEIAIMALCWLVLWGIEQPVLPFLDISLLGVGAFLAFGRLGCYNVGCCYGRPCKSGVKYTDAHANQGFPFYWVGIPLLPIQLIESAGVAITVVIGTWAMLQKMPYGTALICYTVLYGGLRFVLEFFRGDPERPYWGGFSEAQWTTLALFIITAILSWFNWLPFYWVHFIAIVVLIIAMLFIYVIRIRQPFSIHKIINPGHIKEIALALAGIELLKYTQPLPERKVVIPIGITSLGLKISTGNVKEEKTELIFYTLSASGSDKENKKAVMINNKIAKTIARLIQTLKHTGVSFQILEGNPGIYHIVFDKYIER